MSIKKYHCAYCGKKFTTQGDADQCRLRHNLVYIALSSSDLDRLIQFIYTGNQELLTESLIRSLKRER